MLSLLDYQVLRCTATGKLVGGADFIKKDDREIKPNDASPNHFIAADLFGGTPPRRKNFLRVMQSDDLVCEIVVYSNLLFTECDQHTVDMFCMTDRETFSMSYIFPIGDVVALIDEIIPQYERGWEYGGKPFVIDPRD